MYMRAFLIALEKILKKDHADIKLEFYLSRRSKFVHMGLDEPLITIPNHNDIMEFLEKYWEKKRRTINLNLHNQDLYQLQSGNLIIL